MEEPTVPLPSDVIRLLVETNPKRLGSASYKRFSLYVDGITVAQYVEAVRAQIGDSEAKNCALHLQFDSDPRRGFIRIERVGRPLSVSRSASMSYGRRRAKAIGSTRLGRSSARSREAANARRSSGITDGSRSDALLDEELVRAYCANFLGYWNVSSRFWFIGEQEGGGKDFEEAQRRLNAWRSLGSPALADSAQFHRKIGLDWHGAGATSSQRGNLSLVSCLQ